LPCTQIDNPDSKKVAEVASAAGEKWRSLSEEDKRGFEESSEKAKVSIYNVVSCAVSASVSPHLKPKAPMQERLLATAVRDITAGLLWFMLAAFHTYGIFLHLLADRLTVSVLCGLVLT
jgi:hypothetical protein